MDEFAAEKTMQRWLARQTTGIDGTATLGCYENLCHLRRFAPNNWIRAKTVRFWQANAGSFCSLFKLVCNSLSLFSGLSKTRFFFLWSALKTVSKPQLFFIHIFIFISIKQSTERTSRNSRSDDTARTFLVIVTFFSFVMQFISNE